MATKQPATKTKGALNVSLYVDLIQDNSGTNPGDPLTGLLFNSTGLVCYFVRDGALPVQITLVTQTVNGAHTDGGFVEIGATMPGQYRLDITDAVVAAGVDGAKVMLSGFADMIPHVIDITLTSVDLYDAADAGLTALTGNVPQTGDSYPIVSHASYGNAQLVRSTTPANTLTVDASNRAHSNAQAVADNANAATRLKLFSEFGRYTDGFIYLSTNSGTAGTDDYENGTDGNYALTLAELITLKTSLGVSKFKVSNDSSVAFIEDHVSEVWQSQGASLVIGSGAGNDVSKTHFYHFNTISGVGTSPSGETHVTGGHVGDLELGIGHLTGCALTGTYTLGAAANHVLERCYQENGVAPIIDMNSLGGSVLSLMGYHGDLTINNILAGDTIHISGTFGYVILNGADATVNLSGTAATVTDNRTGTPLGTDSAIKEGDISALLTQQDANTAHLTDIKGDTFSGATDSLEAIRDRGDAAYLTATGFATETKQDATDVVIAELTIQGDTNEAKLDLANSDLSKIAGADGVTLATAQALYAPNKVVPDAAGVAATAGEVAASTAAIIAQGDSAWVTGAGGSPPNLLQSTVIEAVTSPTEFVLTIGSPDTGAYDGQVAIFVDSVTEIQKAVVPISMYVGGTRALSLTTTPAFTIAVGDTVHIVAATGTTDISTIEASISSLDSRIPAQAIWDYIEAHAAASQPVTFTVGTEITAIIGTLDGGTAPSESNCLNGRVLYFNNPASIIYRQMVRINAYDGGSKTVSFDSLTSSVLVTDTAILI